MPVINPPGLQSNQVFNVSNVKYYGAVGDGTTDDSTAVIAAIAAAAVNGGTVYFPAATYRINSQLVLPNDGGSPTPKQKSVRLTGAGPSHSSRSQGAIPNGGTILDLRYSGADAKIVSYGEGFLEIDHMTLLELGASTTTPFILVTNTVLHAWALEGYGSTAKTTTTCDQDFILLGGTTVTYDGTSAGPNQGYAHVIERCFINHLRRFAYLRVFANGAQIVNNTVWAQCGSNLAGGACIELDGTASNSAGQTASGNYIAGNLIEMIGYPYGFKVVAGVENQFVFNNLFDASVVAGLAYYRFETGGTYNAVWHGYSNETIAIVSEATANTNAYVTSHQTQKTNWTQPWQFSGVLSLSNANSFNLTLANGTSVPFITIDGANIQTVGNAAFTGNMVFLPGTGKEFRFLNAAQTQYAMDVLDGADPKISFGTNVHDSKFTFYNAVATTGDTLITVRDGAAGAARIKFGSNGGTYDVAIGRSAAGNLEINSGTAGTHRDLTVRQVFHDASTTSNANINLPATGVAPTSPVNGDIWFDGTNLKIQIGGVTKTVTVT